MLLGDLLSFGLILVFCWPMQIVALKCKVQRYDSRNGHIYMDASGQQTCTWDLQPPQNRSDVVVIALRILTFYNKIGFSSGEITLLDGLLFNTETSPHNFFCQTYMKVNSSCGNKASVEKTCGKPPMTSLEWPPVLQATLDDYTFTATYTFYPCNETISNETIFNAPEVGIPDVTPSPSTTVICNRDSQASVFGNALPLVIAAVIAVISVLLLEGIIYALCCRKPYKVERLYDDEAGIRDESNVTGQVTSRDQVATNDHNYYLTSIEDRRYEKISTLKYANDNNQPPTNHIQPVVYN